jgi:hypothetical protein
MLTFLLLTVVAQAAPIPELKVEATDGGSALVIRNTHPSQALTAYLIELVDYPGSTWAFSQDELAAGVEPLGAGRQRRIAIGNMTVGAAPDYVLMRAALYSDGSVAGTADKVAQLKARRALLLATIREALAAKPDELKSKIDATAVSTSKLRRADPEVVNNAARRALLEEAWESRGGFVEKFREREALLSK